MATSLDKLENKVCTLFSNLSRDVVMATKIILPSSAHKALSYDEKIAKIGPVKPEIFDEIRRTTT